MPTSYHIILSDSEDEGHDFPITIILSDSEDEIPPYTSRFASEEDCKEEEEEDPEEEEEEDPEEDPEEEEEEEPEPESPHHSTPPTTIPTHDPYEVPPTHPTTHHRSDARRWGWVPDVIGQWRQQEGSPFRDVGASSSAARPYLVTGEPPQHTIPLLIARTLRQENRIDHLEDAVEILSGPEHVEELQQNVWTLEHRYQNMRDYVEQLSEKVAAGPGRLSEIERRLDGLEQSLEQFHSLADAMRGYADYILKGDHIPK